MLVDWYQCTQIPRLVSSPADCWTIQYPLAKMARLGRPAVDSAREAPHNRI